jgi:hypothetical protein
MATGQPSSCRTRRQACAGAARRGGGACARDGRRAHPPPAGGRGPRWRGPPSVWRCGACAACAAPRGPPAPGAAAARARRRARRSPRNPVRAPAPLAQGFNHRAAADVRLHGHDDPGPREPGLCGDADERRWGPGGRARARRGAAAAAAAVPARRRSGARRGRGWRSGAPSAAARPLPRRGEQTTARLRSERRHPLPCTWPPPHAPPDLKIDAGTYGFAAGARSLAPNGAAAAAPGRPARCQMAQGRRALNAPDTARLSHPPLTFPLPPSPPIPCPKASST